ncbi:MAG: hypothetical protein COA58_05540 [Bacteroidetes bacterium]|nr:MAG: hypothetical protein COA58_05540 [Bacteroidota bacterium]
MKFGKVENPGELDLFLPQDHSDTKRVLESSGDTKNKPNIYVGCAKWNKADLKNFYPKGTGTKELEYYSTQFNSIELNATFYRIFPQSVTEGWYNRSSSNFKFFPKVPQLISQFRRLKNCKVELDDYLASISHLKEKLGMCFLQMHPTFKPEKFDDLRDFIEMWPIDVPLSVELRHTDWYNDTNVSNELYAMLEERGISNTITDTAGRRDLMHMRLTSPSCFVRYTGANHSTDYDRLDEWFERLKLWVDLGIKDIYFFVHQNLEVESPLLSAHFIKRLNEELGYNLTVPNGAQASLF